MLNTTAPLRYKIVNWRQLTNCLSNNSRSLHIHVTDFIQDKRLHGLRITVDHDQYGVVFAQVLGACGTLVTRPTEIDPFVFEMTPGQLLEELKKWGFLIEYNPSASLPSTMVDLLMTVNKLNYDKIRVLNTWKIVNTFKEFRWQVVAFNVDAHSDWINPGYAPREEEYLKGLKNGTAFNVSQIADKEGKQLDWSWLYNWIGDINHILEENADMAQGRVYHE